MLELEDDGVAGAGSTELPGYEDYYDGDPASRERFGPAEREEMVIQASQVMLGTRTGTPPSYRWLSWGHSTGSSSHVGGLEPFTPAQLSADSPHPDVLQEPNLKGEKGEPAIVEPVSGAQPPWGHVTPALCGTPEPPI